MKLLPVLSVAALVSTNAFATGMIRPVHHCVGGSGEYRSTVEVKHFSMSAPRGPVRAWFEARVTSSWLGGTHDSGYVRVEQMMAADGGPAYYFNKKAGFRLNVNSSGVSPSGSAAEIFVSGAEFRDETTKRKVSISNRLLRCK